jgi:hypothetical protein
MWLKSNYSVKLQSKSAVSKTIMYKIEINSNYQRNQVLLNWIICIYIHVSILNKSISGTSHCYTLTNNETCFYINSSSRVIKIGGLYDIEGNRPGWMGYSELMASKIAVKHFNDHSEQYKIELLVNDSKVGM